MLRKLNSNGFETPMKTICRKADWTFAYTQVWSSLESWDWIQRSGIHQCEGSTWNNVCGQASPIGILERKDTSFKNLSHLENDRNKMPQEFRWGGGIRGAWYNAATSKHSFQLIPFLLSNLESIGSEFSTKGINKNLQRRGKNRRHEEQKWEAESKGLGSLFL